MDENQEEVVYSFIGDNSSLREATKQAIGMLDKYDAAMQKAASQDTFKASKTSVKSFQRTVGGLIKQVNTLTAALNSTGDDLQKSMPNGAAIVSAATTDLADVLSYLDETSNLASDDLKFLTEVLKGTKAELESVASRASVLSSSFKPLEQLNAPQVLNETSNAAEQAETKLNKVAFAGFRVQEAYVASGKSATESAAAIYKLTKSTERLNSVQAVVNRVSNELNFFGAYARSAWSQFEAYLSPVIAKLQSFKDKATNVLNRVTSLLSQVSSAFRRTAKSSDSSGNSFDGLNKKTKKLSSGLGSLISTLRAATAGSKGLSIVTGLLKSAFKSLVGVSVGEWLAKASNESIKFIENLNLFTVAMGDAYETGFAFVSQMQELYGMDPSNLMRYAGNFYQLADAIKMPDQAAANLSLGLTKATNDIASLFNMDVETVFENLSSGMQGMSRAVRKYGMDIRTVTLQATAASLGIEAEVETMSEANRQGLRFITMMQQASNASGDFAKNINQPANQLRIFKEQMSQLARSIGDLFIKPLGVALQYLNGFVMALRVVIQYLGTLLGLVEDLESTVSIAEDASDYLENIGTEADKTAKKLKKMVAPFDELNVMSDPSNSGDVLGDLGDLDPRIEEAIASMKWELDDVKMKANEVRDALLSFFGFTTDSGKIISWKLKIPSIETELDPILRAVSNLFVTIWNSLQRLWNDSIWPMLQQVGAALTPVLETLGSLWQNVSAILTNVINLLSEVWVSTVEPLLSALMGTIGSLMELFQALWETTLGPIIGYIGDSLQHLWTQTLGPLVADLMEIIGGLIELILNLWNNVLSPLVSFIVNLFGPAIAAAFQSIWNVIEFVVSLIGAILGTLTGMFSGVIEYLNGIFTGDWKRALSGLLNVWVALGNGIVGVLEAACNLGIGLINSFLSTVIGGCKGLVNGLGDLIEGLASYLGFSIDLNADWSIPQIPNLTIPRIPKVALASGAVVTGPTTALIGEGRYDEAVIPLGNSPQMNEFADNVASRVNSGEQITLLREQNELLRQILDKTGVDLDGRELTDALSMHQRNRARSRGV